MLRSPVSAVVKAADGSLYRVKGEEREMLHSSDEIRAGEVLHATAGDGAILEMKDGSRVEIRSQSELVLENASDGMRIQLKLGGVIVDAAAQHRGHLYVMTKDITVSVLGTVFLVNTQDEGSIVAVIEGEVHVQQGTTEKKLRPGQQVATSTKLESRPVSQEIAWSRNAEEHVTRLQETTVGPLEQTGQTGSSEPALAFGAVSIKPVLPGTSRTVGFVCKGVDGTRRTYEGTEGAPNAPVAVQGRCLGTNLYAGQLIGFAYGVPGDGRQVGPKWAVPGGRTPAGAALEASPEGGVGARYQIEAVADDPSTVTIEQLIQMTRTMLADRFKLKFHRETEDVPGYALMVGSNGSTPELKSAPGVDERPAASYYNDKGLLVTSGRTTMEKLAQFLSGFNRGMMPVIDKTGLQGMFEYEIIRRTPGGGVRGGGAARREDTPFPPSLDDLRRNQAELWGQWLAPLGLQLREEKSVPAEIIVIDHIERPSAN
jgi:uncharacterized protein (TIGR03435 family)